LFSGTFLFTDFANEHKDVPPVLGIWSINWFFTFAKRCFV